MKITRQKFSAYARLMRLDKPIGIYLVLWPCLWGLWLGAEGLPRWDTVVIFVLGVLLMRSAGCVINDYADRNIDGSVERTRLRPLVSGEVNDKEALLLFFALCALAFALVLLTNRLTILLSFGGVALALCYPFMKRYTHLPQVVLGAAFAWSIPMAFAATRNAVPPSVWLIYTTVLVWTLCYDTFYAMVDRDDDLKIGVKSTAILFGELDRLMTGLLQFIVVFALALIGQRFELGNPYKISIAVVILLFAYQQWLIAGREKARCFRAFLNNNWVGAAVFIGIVCDYTLK